jgi:hypothetical protein
MRAETTMTKTTVYLLPLVFGLLVQSKSYACSCREESKEEQFRTANYVALIKVTGTALRSIKDLRREIDDYDDWKNETPDYVRVSYEELEVFKGRGNAPKHLRELPFGPGNCMLGLFAGMEYVVYLSEDSMGFVVMCSGSFGVFNREGDEVVPVLNLLRAWAKSPP